MPHLLRQAHLGRERAPLRQQRAHAAREHVVHETRSGNLVLHKQELSLAAIYLRRQPRVLPVKLGIDCVQLGRRRGPPCLPLLDARRLAESRGESLRVVRPRSALLGVAGVRGLELAAQDIIVAAAARINTRSLPCLLYTSPSPRDRG